jgi:hypothetical protein
MSTPSPDIAARRTERRLRRALRHRNASPYVRSIKERLDADMPRRLEAFASGKPEAWTEIIRRAREDIEKRGLRDPSARRCDYSPWTKALAAIGAEAIGLIGIADDIGRPPWPEDRQNLIEFVLTYLEADPMLHRSGYTKRHLLDRLRQSKLSDAQTDRLVAVLQRAVQRGIGQEEFRACCRIAAALNPRGLAEWLRPLASEAKLGRWNHLTGADQRMLPAGYGKKGWPGPALASPAHAIPSDLRSDPIPMTPADWADPRNKAAVNAWRMLRAIERRSEAGHEGP